MRRPRVVLANMAMTRLPLPLRAVCAALLHLVAATAARTADPGEAGTPWVRELTAAEFPSTLPVFGAAVSPEGLLYFSSINRLLEYDGHRVRELPVPAVVTNARLGPLALDARG